MSPPLAPQQQPVQQQQHHLQQQFNATNGAGVVVQKRVLAEDGMTEGVERPHKLPNQQV